MLVDRHMAVIEGDHHGAGRQRALACEKVWDV